MYIWMTYKTFYMPFTPSLGIIRKPSIPDDWIDNRLIGNSAHGKFTMTIFVFALSLSLRQSFGCGSAPSITSGSCSYDICKTFWFFWPFLPPICPQVPQLFIKSPWCCHLWMVPILHCHRNRSQIWRRRRPPDINIGQGSEGENINSYLGMGKYQTSGNLCPLWGISVCQATSMEPL